MCGIFGGVFPADQKKLESRMQAASRILSHRGPDDEGELIKASGDSIVAFGHKRLSVIDLSARGRQPFVSSDGRLVLTYNGEIYNYMELRKELVALGRSFTTQTDTEVLLQAWVEWGVACLPRLVGMFAFAIWDQNEGSITLCRDAFGMKPLFYSLQNGKLLFASETAALRLLSDAPARLNHQRSYDYLVRGHYDSNEETFFAGVKHLLPGYFMRFDVARKQAQPPMSWNRLDIAEDQTISFEHAAEKLRELFLSSVRLHMRSDVPLGAMLSGGVDSSAVVCAMRLLEPDLDLHTFSFIAKGSEKSEEHWVDAINRHTGAIAHKVTLSPNGLLTDIDSLILRQGEPFGSSRIYAHYGVCRAIREAGVTVILEGQGADGLLAGHMGYPGPRLRSLLERGAFLRAWRFLSNWSKWPGRSCAMGLKLLVDETTQGNLNALLRRLNGKSLHPDWVRVQKLDDNRVIRGVDAAIDSIRGRRLPAALRCALTKRGGPYILRNSDRNSMAFSIESRSPFLTTELAHFMLSLPETYLVSDEGETKSVFRAAMRGIVPDEILDRKDKIGFETPEHEWLAQKAKTIKTWLSRDLTLSWVNNERLGREFEMIMSGQRAFSWQAWRWICFTRWQQLHEVQE